MKKKALVVVLLCVMGLATICIGNADAAWFTCTMGNVGTSGGGTYIVLSDTAGSPAFTNQWFVFDTSLGQDKSMLASALTAFANSSNVYVNVSGTSAYSTVLALFVIK
jgi:hypothetical protein